jgi:predicted RNase H-like HicB family nuclease
VTFPDLPGCLTAGDSLEEARANAAEALALHLDGLAEEGLPAPAPVKGLDEIMADPANRAAVGALRVPLPDAKWRR